MNAKFIILFAFEERGMRIQHAHHTLDGIIHQIFRAYFFDITLMDFCGDIVEPDYIRIETIVSRFPGIHDQSSQHYRENRYADKVGFWLISHLVLPLTSLTHNQTDLTV